MSGDVDRLRGRFADVLRRAGASGDGTAVFDELVARYGEARRHYHTLEHIDACLGWLDRFAGLAERPTEVALALWFHDVIYDPHAGDNEQRSADLARDRLVALGVPSESVDRVAVYILATQHHEAEQGDARLVVDIDLTILGSSRAVFDDFEQRIRREYAHVSDELFDAGRRAVLARFLDRPAIYRVAEIHERLEAAARENLERRIRELDR